MTSMLTPGGSSLRISSTRRPTACTTSRLFDPSSIITVPADRLAFAVVGHHAVAERRTDPDVGDVLDEHRGLPRAGLEDHAADLILVL